jgi:hypothetical protein
MKRFALALSVMLPISALTSATEVGSSVKTPPYRVVGGRVDDATFAGWRVYHQACHGCHGVDAIGTSLAPSLVDKMHDMSSEAFAIKVATSYRIVLGLEAATSDDPNARREALLAALRRREDPVLLMPAWDGDPKVEPHLGDLYAYLKARSDGKLGPGRPPRISNLKSTWNR